MFTFNFLRLRVKPPVKSPPPRNFVDLYYDPEEGTIKAINAAGEVVAFYSVGGGGGSITSSDVTDATSDGATNGGKLLKSASGILPPGEAGGIRLIHLTIPQTAGSVNEVRIDYSRVQKGGALMDWPAASGTLACLPQYANSTAANAAVSVGDAWWDTTLNKARVRLS